jgi:hypothetical protein
LPIEVRELPSDLAALAELLVGPGLLAPFTACWQREALMSGVSAAGYGRPTIAIKTYVRGGWPGQSDQERHRGFRPQSARDNSTDRQN